MASTINGTSTGNGGLISTGDDSGILNIQTNETTAITVDASQNVGIGATTPADALNIGTGKKFRATHSASVYQQIFSSSSGNFINAYGDSLQLTADSGAIYLTTTAAQPMVFQTTNADRMRIDSSGNVIISGSTTLDCVFNVYGKNGVAPCSLKVFTNGDYGYTFKNASGTLVGAIGVNASTTSYNTSSDYRLKENIAPMTGALAKVAQLKPVTYKWKLDSSDGEGFIAHELAEVCPHAVSGEKDATREQEYEVTPAVKDEEGNITTPAVMGTRTVPAYQGIDTSFLVATLTAALQETKALIDTQAETINALTARIVALEQA